MGQPMSLTTLPKPIRQPESSTSIPQVGVLAVQNTSPVSSAIRDTNQNLMKGDCKLVKAIVVGDHEIPTHVAMHIPISVPKATAGCDICIEGPSQVQRVFFFLRLLPIAPVGITGGLRWSAPPVSGAGRIF